ncbi:hypothetical protein KAZ66_01710 [Candidatus Woesebacteria bacterium]|nr:hypothetical protein [Candidatus Woesebacteria bacterium]
METRGYKYPINTTLYFPEKFILVTIAEQVVYNGKIFYTYNFMGKKMISEEDIDRLFRESKCYIAQPGHNPRWLPEARIAIRANIDRRIWLRQSISVLLVILTFILIVGMILLSVLNLYGIFGF